MTVALYRKYRSKTLEEVIGQSHVTDVLSRALKKQKTVHAYLLTGPRGVGKTSVARILAHEINKLPYTDESEHLDIIEIDAASNNSVDDVRELREKAYIAPVTASRKIYIIDEVHMLSKPAFNALLKILEEPPEHIVFILATTDADKLPDTIISRTQRYHFRLVAQADVVKHLTSIAKQESIAIEPSALELIAERGGGSFRDSITLLDQLRHASDKKITRQLVESTLGLATHDAVIALVEAVVSRQAAAVIEQLELIEAQGVSSLTLASQLLPVLRQQLNARPELVTVLESVADVAHARHPEIALLTAVLRLAVPASAGYKTVAASAAPAKTVELPQTVPATAKPAVIKQKPKTEVQRMQNDASDSAVSDDSKVLADPVMPPNPEKFNWDAVLDHAKAHFVALHSVLKQSTPVIEGDTLKLYTGKKFHKSKLDDARYRPLIAKCLHETGAGDFIIETIGTPPPPKDSQAAKIAAIMGGGEEVDVG